MNDKRLSKVPWTFWVIGLLILIWYALGSLNFLVQVTNPEIVASMKDSHRMIIESRPVWATVSFGVAVLGGFLGCVLLLLRRIFAISILILSLSGVVVTLVPNIKFIGSYITDPMEIVMTFVMSLVIAGFLVWYALRAKNKMWLR